MLRYYVVVLLYRFGAQILMQKHPNLMKYSVGWGIIIVNFRGICYNFWLNCQWFATLIEKLGFVGAITECWLPSDALWGFILSKFNGFIANYFIILVLDFKCSFIDHNGDKVLMILFSIYLQLRLRSIGILGIALGTILHLRLSLPGPTTQFSTADNPTAKVNSILTRFYTFLYLPVFNFKLLLYPQTMSFDWGMDAIPRVTSLFEFRTFLSLVFYAALGHTVWKSLTFLRKKLPVPLKRKARSMNRKRITSQPKIDELPEDVQESYCVACKQGFGVRHSSVCRALNGDTINGCSCNQLISKFISLSPLKQYITKTSSHLPGGQNNNDESVKDNNNNNYSAMNNNNYCSLANNSPNELNLSIKHSVHKAKLICVANTDAVELSKATKLNNASVVLISITLLTLPFLPAANLFFYVGFVVAERILYLPSVGYCLLIGLGLGKLISVNGKVREKSGKSKHKLSAGEKSRDMRSMLTIAFLVMLISVFCVKTIRRNMDWRDEESLYRSAVGVNPPKGKN